MANETFLFSEIIIRIKRFQIFFRDHQSRVGIVKNASPFTNCSSKSWMQFAVCILKNSTSRPTDWELDPELESKWRWSRGSKCQRQEGPSMSHGWREWVSVYVHSVPYTYVYIYINLYLGIVNPLWCYARSILVRLSLDSSYSACFI